MKREPHYSEEELKRIIRTGEERHRWGQANRPEASEALHRERRVLAPPNPVTRAVAALTDELEADKFHAMGDPREWQRLHEIQEVAREQVEDDLGFISASRIGRERVVPFLHDGGEEPIWMPLTQEQEALQMGFDPFLRMDLKDHEDTPHPRTQARLLTPTQRRVIQLRHWIGLSQKEAAIALGVGKQSVQSSERQAEDNLRRALLERYVEEAPDDTARPVAADLPA